MLTREHIEEWLPHAKDYERELSETALALYAALHKMAHDYLDSESKPTKDEQVELMVSDYVSRAETSQPTFHS